MIKAKYIGEWDPEYQPGEIYTIHETENNFSGRMIEAENKHGESYLMPRELFLPVEE